MLMFQLKLPRFVLFFCAITLTPFSFAIYAPLSSSPVNCNPENDYAEINAGKLCSNLLFLNEVMGFKMYLQQINTLNLTQWWITSSSKLPINFTFRGKYIDKIIMYRFLTPNVEVIFKSSEGYDIAFWNIIALNPDPVVIPLTNADVAAFKFQDEQKTLYIFEAFNKELSKRVYISGHETINPSDTLLKIFSQNIKSIQLYPNETNHLIIKLEDDTHELIDYTKSMPLSAVENKNSVPKQSFHEGHTTMVIIGFIIISILAICVYGVIKGLKILRGGTSGNRKPTIFVPEDQREPLTRPTTTPYPIIPGSTANPTFTSSRTSPSTNDGGENLEDGV